MRGARGWNNGRIVTIFASIFVLLFILEGKVVSERISLNTLRRIGLVYDHHVVVL